MKIGFVAEPYEESGYSGMGYMVFQLMKHLPEASQDHEFTIYSSTPITVDLIRRPVRNVIVPASLVGKFFWFLSAREPIDVLLFVTPLLPLVLPRKIKAIAICPELGSQKITPGSFKEKAVAFIRDHLLMPVSLSRAAGVISISEATKKDLIQFYGIPENKITVIYVGFQDLTIYRDAAPPVRDGMQPYFFFTGRAKPRKNVHGIISAFIRFKERTHADCKLVISGKGDGPYINAMKDELVRHGFSDDVYFIGFVSPAELCSYYLHALALVFPSFNEGFGMPVVEAMSLGTSVITSKISSLPEAAGDAALLVDPHSVEEISEGMEKIFTDAEFRASLIKKGFVQAKQFSWKRTAEQCLTFFQKTVS